MLLFAACYFGSANFVYGFMRPPFIKYLTNNQTITDNVKFLKTGTL